MIVNEVTLISPGYPAILRHIAAPPKQLFVARTPLAEIMAKPRVAIVGSRKVSTYGREVTTQLARALAERGIVIISGLALGVDALAHRATLEAGGITVAVLPGPIEQIYPASHRQLARQIIERGGTLISEYKTVQEVFRVNFIARNRIVSGLCDALLITEAAEMSGTLHTARFALEQGKEVLAVPGSIFSDTSRGTNNLIKAGAMPVTNYRDVLHSLGLEDANAPISQTLIGAPPEEQVLLNLLAKGVRDNDTLLAISGMEITALNQTLTMLEITGKVHSSGGGQWTLG
jgi:DNA processing protein